MKKKLPKNTLPAGRQGKAKRKKKVVAIPPVLPKKQNKVRFPQFPKFYRTITERLQIRRHGLLYIVAFVSLVLFAVVLIVGYQTYLNYQHKQALEQKRQQILSDISFWQGIVEKYPDYRDGYFELALLEYQIKDFAKAKAYTEKSLSIDPNFEKGVVFVGILNSK